MDPQLQYLLDRALVPAQGAPAATPEELAQTARHVGATCLLPRAAAGSAARYRAAAKSASRSRAAAPRVAISEGS